MGILLSRSPCESIYLWMLGVALGGPGLGLLITMSHVSHVTVVGPKGALAAKSLDWGLAPSRSSAVSLTARILPEVYHFKSQLGLRSNRLGSTGADPRAHVVVSVMGNDNFIVATVYLHPGSNLVEDFISYVKNRGCWHHESELVGFS
jgi:hypothetical protein